jgi:hypothetical protein
VGQELLGLAGLAQRLLLAEVGDGRDVDDVRQQLAQPRGVAGEDLADDQRLGAGERRAAGAGGDRFLLNRVLAAAVEQRLQHPLARGVELESPVAGGRRLDQRHAGEGGTARQQVENSAAASRTIVAQGLSGE